MFEGIFAFIRSTMNRNPMVFGRKGLEKIVNQTPEIWVFLPIPRERYVSHGTNQINRMIFRYFSKVYR